MSADDTRLLVLGAVASFEPVNGYQLRRELLSWGVSDWASTKPGSIYSMLNSLNNDALIERHELPDGNRTVAVYTTNVTGRQRFRQMVADALQTVNPMAPVGFQVGLNFATHLPREDVLTSLRTRASNLSLMIGHFDTPEYRETIAAQLPPFIARGLGLSVARMKAEAGWLTEHIAEIESGEFSFGGEVSAPWTPPTDDPGWAMAADHERYQALIDEQRRIRQAQTSTT